MRETVMMADLSWTHFAEKVSEKRYRVHPGWRY
jgi:hypothetical protein